MAARVAAEGVMLQYAVDTKLDELLSSLWLQLTKPPLSLNPYPRMMHIIRYTHQNHHPPKSPRTCTNMHTTHTCTCTHTSIGPF